MYLINPDNINEEKILQKINLVLEKYPEMKILTKGIDETFLKKIDENFVILNYIYEDNSIIAKIENQNIKRINVNISNSESRKINSKKHCHFFQDEIFENSFRMLSKPEIESVKLAAFAVDNKNIYFKESVFVLLGYNGKINSGIALKAAGKKDLLQTRIIEKVFQPYF